MQKKFKFSSASKSKLLQADFRLQRLFEEVIKHYDCTIVETVRGSARQNELNRTGFSDLRWPDSKHNKTPSLAVDAAPFPSLYSDTDEFIFFGGLVCGIASVMDIPIVWGGHWDNPDMAHFELCDNIPL